MNFLSSILRFLFWVVVISWSIRLLCRAIGSMLSGAAGAPAPGTDKFAAQENTGTPRRLVRDPVCGTHVAEEVSIPLREGDLVLRFCSAACRDAYVDTTRKMAANG